MWMTILENKNLLYNTNPEWIANNITFDFWNNTEKYNKIRKINS